MGIINPPRPRVVIRIREHSTRLIVGAQKVTYSTVSFPSLTSVISTEYASFADWAPSPPWGSLWRGQTTYYKLAEKKETLLGSRSFPSLFSVSLNNPLDWSFCSGLSHSPRPGTPALSRHLLWDRVRNPDLQRRGHQLYAMLSGTWEGFLETPDPVEIATAPLLVSRKPPKRGQGPKSELTLIGPMTQEQGRKQIKMWSRVAPCGGSQT